MKLENNTPQYSPILESIKRTDPIFMENDKIDVLIPAIAMTDITCIVGEMLEDNLAYVKKNGDTAKSKASRGRLLKLLNITETFNNITSQNTTLKIYNYQLFREVQELRNYKKEIIRQETLSKSL